MLTYADVCGRMLTYADVCCTRAATYDSFFTTTISLLIFTTNRILMYYMCVCADTRVGGDRGRGDRRLVLMCPHTTIYVSSHYYICVLIRVYILHIGWEEIVDE
jgi:hypothetical protein